MAIRMPFGKHRGRELSEIDTAYLLWLTGRSLYPWLRAAVIAELETRELGDDEAMPPDECEHPGIAAWRENWRRIIFLAHPDRGGNEELCKLLVNINDAMNMELAVAS